MNRLLRSLAVLLILTAPALYAAEPKETIHVVITGGPNAGTYDGTTDRGGCSAGLTGKDSWGNQYSPLKENDPKKLNGLQLTVPDAKEAAKGTHNFFLNVAFGRITARVAEYKVETEKKSGSGTVTVTFDTATSATFVVNLSGFPAGTPINIAHIHQAVAGTTGSIVVSTTLTAGEVVLASGGGTFTKSGIPVDAALEQTILNNPAGFYFNVHSTLNPGGVARGQLVRVQ